MANNLKYYKANIKDNMGILHKKFTAAPVELKAFALLAVVVTILQFIIFFFAKQDVRIFYSEKLGVSTGSSYGFTIFFVFALIFANRESRPNVLRFGIVAPLIITLSLKCLVLLSIINDGGKFEKSGNVGLVWSIIIPAIWIIVIFSPAVSKFCRKKLSLQNQDKNI
jgi:hypothetical protein